MPEEKLRKKDVFEEIINRHGDGITSRQFHADVVDKTFLHGEETYQEVINAGNDIPVELNPDYATLHLLPCTTRVGDAWRKHHLNYISGVCSAFRRKIVDQRRREKALESTHLSITDGNTAIDLDQLISHDSLGSQNESKEIRCMYPDKMRNGTFNFPENMTNDHVIVALQRFAQTVGKFLTNHMINIKNVDTRIGLNDAAKAEFRNVIGLMLQIIDEAETDLDIN